MALCSSLSIKISASLLLPHLILLLSVFLTESYSSFSLSSPPPPPTSSFPPFCAFPPPYSTLLIFKSHMLPARLAQLHPANEGLFIGLRLSAAKQGLARAEAGASLAAPHPPAAQTTPHACSGLALSPRSRLLVSAVLNCRQQLKRATERERHCRERRGNSVGLLSCYLTSLDSKVCVPAVKSWLSISGFY